MFRPREKLIVSDRAVQQGYWTLLAVAVVLAEAVASARLGEGHACWPRG